MPLELLCAVLDELDAEPDGADPDDIVAPEVDPEPEEPDADMLGPVEPEPADVPPEPEADIAEPEPDVVSEADDPDADMDEPEPEESAVDPALPLGTMAGDPDVVECVPVAVGRSDDGVDKGPVD